MKKKLTVVVTYNYEIEIDTDNGIVKEYESESDLIEHLVSYRFSDGLPVIGKGVKVTDISTNDYYTITPSSGHGGNEEI